jgi:hypothetical protein
MVGPCHGLCCCSTDKDHGQPPPFLSGRVTRDQALADALGVSSTTTMAVAPPHRHGIASPRKSLGGPQRPVLPVSFHPVAPPWPEVVGRTRLGHHRCRHSPQLLLVQL